MNRPHYSTSHFLVSLLLLVVLFQHFFENSPPRFTSTWQYCSHRLHRTSHHPQCAVANCREILMKMGSASSAIVVAGTETADRPRGTRSGCVPLCLQALFENRLFYITTTLDLSDNDVCAYRVLLMDSSIFCCPAPRI